jgi:Protein of unknown function (DUF3987)
MNGQRDNEYDTSGLSRTFRSDSYTKSPLRRIAPAKLDDAASDEGWRDPDRSLLDDRRGTLPDFPLDALTDEWRTWLENAAHGAGVTPAHVMVPLLSLASSLIGAARRIRASSSWSEPFTNWTCVVGFSGTGKTPGLDVSRRALAAIERSRKHKLGELQREHETRVETAKAAAKKWRAEVEAAVEAGDRPPPMPEQAVLPGAFITPRLYVSNVTIERLATLLQARQRGALMICDELAGLFLNMSRYTNGTDKAFWLEAWNGGPYVQERQSRPPVTVDHLLVGMTGGFQPDKLARSFAGDDDGMYARVLFAWPPEPNYRPLSDEISEVDPAFQTALMRLIDLKDTEDGAFVSKDIPLSGGASKAFAQFRQFLHEGRDALEGREREWWAKGATHVLRLAGTLSYLDWAMRNADEPPDIGEGFMVAAVRLWRDYFWPHACAALRQVGISDEHANARRALLWARANGKNQISVEDVRREALKQRVNAEQAEAVLGKLERAGWLKKSTQMTRGVGPGRRRHRWIVNSQLLVPERAAEIAGNAEKGRAY